MANDLTVRIFDNFYNLDLAVNANDYEIVYSFFKENCKSDDVAKAYTETLFRVSNTVNVPVMELLQNVEGKSKMDIQLTLAYYLNTISPTKTVLYGINSVIVPNENTQRNILQDSTTMIPVKRPLPAPPFVPVPPVAGFTANILNGSVPLTVKFTDDTTNAPISWEWDFKNDGTATSTQQNPTYTYDSVGTYTVKLIAQNAFGSDDIIKTNYITVTVPPSPNANFIGSPTSGFAPLTVDFTDTTTNDPTSWEWDFKNDGTATSTQQNPTYTYDSVGTYTVKLTVENDYGAVSSRTKTDFITVNQRPPKQFPLDLTGAVSTEIFKNTDIIESPILLRNNSSQEVFQSSNINSLPLSYELTPIGPDPYYDNVSLLLHFDGPDESTIFTDYSKHGNTILFNGAANLTTGNKRFGTSSLRTSSDQNFKPYPPSGWTSGGGVYTNPSSIYCAGAGDWTIECWGLRLSTQNNSYLFQVSNGGPTAYYGYGSGGPASGTNQITVSYKSWYAVVPIGYNVWLHYALVKYNNKISFYVNGTTVASVNNNFDVHNDPNTYVEIGCLSNLATAWVGYIDDFRYTPGIARYTTPSFAPQAYPFQNY